VFLTRWPRALELQPIHGDAMALQRATRTKCLLVTWSRPAVHSWQNALQEKSRASERGISTIACRQNGLILLYKTMQNALHRIPDYRLRSPICSCGGLCSKATPHFCAGLPHMACCVRPHTLRNSMQPLPPKYLRNLRETLGFSMETVFWVAGANIRESPRPRHNS